MAFEGDVHTRERFAHAVIKMADVFGKSPSQYDSLIEAYWSALAEFIPIEKFEELCGMYVREMYRMPTPKHFMDYHLNRQSPNNETAKAPSHETLEEERIHKEGLALLRDMDAGKKDILFEDARALVEGTLGDFGEVINQRTMDTMVQHRACQIAVKRAKR